MLHAYPPTRLTIEAIPTKINIYPVTKDRNYYSYLSKLRLQLPLWCCVFVALLLGCQAGLAGPHAAVLEEV